MVNLIQSFSGQVLSWGLGTWMYSSDVPVRPVLEEAGNLRDTLDTSNVEVLDYQDEVSMVHALSKPIRGMARLIYAQAVGCFVAPVGMAYNGLAWWKEKRISNDANSESAQKAKAYWEAFYQDCSHFTSAALTVMILGIQVCCRDSTSEHIPYLLPPGPLALLYAWNPISMSAYMAPEPLASGLAQAIALKSYYGLQKEGGGLLAFGQEDTELPVSGLIRAKWEQVGEEILHHYALAFFLADQDASKLPQPPSAATLSRWLRRNGASPEWIEGLRRLEREFKQLMGLRQTCLKAAPGHYHDREVPSFPWSMDECKARVRKRLQNLYQPEQRVKTKDWQDFLSQQLASLPALEEGTELVQAFREKMLEGASPADLLSCGSQAGPDAAKKCYRRLVLALHPDRCPNQDPESSENKECQILFQTLRQAYAIVNQTAED